MWLMVLRPPLPDVPYWRGRRWFAAVDAVGWPIGWIMLVQAAPVPVGVAGAVIIGLAVCAGVRRLYRAICANHRYRFTAWRWGRYVAILILLGFVLKLAMG
jgi:hypothetical protein